VNATPVTVVTGGAGFIGTNLVRRLHSEGRRVVVLDKVFSIDVRPSADGVIRVPCDLAEEAGVERGLAAALAIGPIDDVWHLAANSDVRAGTYDPELDLRNTFMTTFELLRGLRRHGIRRLRFTSSSAIYGDLAGIPVSETAGPLLPISNYGAMKLASEAQCSAAAQDYLERVDLLRLPNVVGMPATHGVILDLVDKLLTTPGRLEVLGDGSQRKPYLHVDDLISAMFAIRDHPAEGRVQAFNIGPDDNGVTVKWIAQRVVARIQPGARIVFGAGGRGWLGDVPQYAYSTQRLRLLGWLPELDSAHAVELAIDEIARQRSSAFQ